ncbi:MAG: hypothetical protein EPO26_04865 [Chloroflexota bacterium]|nr:MAG: hypothetical protein EPO26_04865 [Chloroflexota bacterium]
MAAESRVISRGTEGTDTQADGPAIGSTARLSLTPGYARVGEAVRVRGEGFAPGVIAQLIWHTVDARYELERGTEYLGQGFSERSWTLRDVRADRDGAIDATFEVPRDFGGSHDVRARVGDQEVAQAGLIVTPTISLSPSEGPIGTEIEVTIVGVEWRPNTSVWHMLYDNKYLGFLSAVTQRGVATAHIRAAGPLGRHVIALWRNAYNSTPYLARDASPFRDMPGPGTELMFTVTSDDGPPDQRIEDFSTTDHPWPSLTTGPGSLSVFPDRGRLGDAIALHAIHLPPSTEVAVRWWTTVGDRITNVGMVEEARMRRVLTTDARGQFAFDMTIPDDLGGQHKIDVIHGDQVLASTGVVIVPALVEAAPRRLRVGEKIDIHLKGLGWTTYDNTYTVTYDNAYIGYVCGFSTGGDVRFTVTATGVPGTHIVDLYPTIYKEKDPSVMPRGMFSVPQLTYRDDHPQRRTPAVRLAFEIVE